MVAHGPSSPLAFGASCGLSSFHQSDSSMDSFTWSDFPVYDEATISKDELPSASFAFLSFEPEEDEFPVLDFSSSWPTAKYSPKVPPINTCSNNSSSSSSSSNNKNSKKRPVPQTALRNQKTTKVRFAPTLEVRTHSIVLGDHPSCEDGLALELGWDYEMSRDIMPSHQEPLEDRTSRWRLLGKRRKESSAPTNPYPRLLSLPERKRLLLEVGGFSEAELEKSRFKAKFLLGLDNHRSSSSSRSSNTNKVARSSPPQPPSASSSSPTSRAHECSIPMPRVGSVRKSLSLYAAVA